MASSEWDDVLYGMGLIPPEQEDEAAAPAGVPSLQSARNFLFAPLPDSGPATPLHSLATSIGPSGSTVANTFLATMGAPPAARGFLGASKALDELDAFLASLKQPPAPAATAPKDYSGAQPINIWKIADPKWIPVGHPVQAGEGGPIGTFKGVSPGGTTMVDWKAPTAAAKTPPSALSDEAISAALAKDPGASIFDLAGHSEMAPKPPTSAPRAPADYSHLLEPFDWKGFEGITKPVLPPGLAERVEALGFNPNTSLWKGGYWDKYDTSFHDPLAKGTEKASFLAEDPQIAEEYGKPLEYLARPSNPFSVEWRSAAPSKHFDEQVMHDLIESARARGADLLHIKGIRDMGGMQNQIAVLDPSILRAPTAAFDPAQLYKAAPLAGVAGATLASPFLFDEDGKPYIQTR